MTDLLRRCFPDVRSRRRFLGPFLDRQLQPGLRVLILHPRFKLRRYSSTSCLNLVPPACSLCCSGPAILCQPSVLTNPDIYVGSSIRESGCPIGTKKFKRHSCNKYSCLSLLRITYEQPSRGRTHSRPLLLSSSSASTSTSTSASAWGSTTAHKLLSTRNLSVKIQGQIETHSQPGDRWILHHL